MNINKKYLLMMLISFLIFPGVLAAEIIQVGPSDFMPGNTKAGDWRIHEENTGWCLYLDGTSTHWPCYYHFKQLPHNGTLDQLRIYYYDNDGNALTVKFLRKDMDSDVTYILATWTSSGSIDAVRVADIETFAKPTIKSKGYQYYLQVLFPSYSSAGSVRIHSVRLRYYSGE